MLYAWAGSVYSEDHTTNMTHSDVQGRQHLEPLANGL